MHDLIIKQILDEYEIENSEQLSQALAKVFKELARNRSFANEMSKSIKENDKLMDRMHGITR
ncbi:hypothetical protein [Streptococcus sp. NLN64]|uniref:hypothetical protein n=1 Tax=Streptococcus sp. NLN64 TaxID=2822799 RepID=UPI0018CB21FC|nr:hypothetical protein [Streptococcus sp. NLN64]MBG9366513.1 hypothetical protein [Streptococcus sp. NLN64]